MTQSRAAIHGAVEIATDVNYKLAPGVYRVDDGAAQPEAFAARLVSESGDLRGKNSPAQGPPWRQQ